MNEDSLHGNIPSGEDLLKNIRYRIIPLVLIVFIVLTGFIVYMIQSSYTRQLNEQMTREVRSYQQELQERLEDIKNNLTTISNTVLVKNGLVHQTDRKNNLRPYLQTLDFPSLEEESFGIYDYRGERLLSGDEKTEARQHLDKSILSIVRSNGGYLSIDKNLFLMVVPINLFGNEEGFLTVSGSEDTVNSLLSPIFRSDEHGGKLRIVDPSGNKVWSSGSTMTNQDDLTKTQSLAISDLQLIYTADYGQWGWFLSSLLWWTVGFITIAFFSMAFGVIAIAKRVAEPLRKTGEKLSENESFLRKLNDIVHDLDRDSDQKIRDVLGLGLETFDLEIGYISFLDDETLEFQYVTGDQAKIREGQVYEVDQSYCRLALERNEPVHLESAQDVKEKLDKGTYEKNEFDAYMGSKIVLNNESEKVFSVCLVKEEPRSKSFTDSDRLKFQHLVQWVQSALQRKQDLEQIRENERRIHQMAESMDEAFFLVASDYSEGLFANAAYQEMFAVRLEEFYRDPTLWQRHLVDEDQEKIDEYLIEQRYGEFTESQKQNYRIDHPQKGIIHIEARIYPIRENGELVRIAGVAADITTRVKAEQKLEETVEELRETRISRDFFQSIIDTITAGVLIVDQQGKITSANELIINMTGYQDGTLIGRDVDTIFETDTSPRAMDEKMYNTPVEFQLSRSDGESVPVLFSMSEIQSEHETNKHVYSVVDISQQKNVERRLRESQRQFEQFAETIDEIFWMVETDWNNFEYINSAYEDIVGRSRETLMNEDPTDFLEGFHPDDRQKTRDMMKRLSAGEDVDWQVRANPDENYQRRLLIHGRTVEKDDGSVQRILGTAQDITDLSTVKEELKRKNRRLTALVENTSEAIYIKNRDGEYIFVNQAVADIFDEPREEILGKTDQVLFDEKSAEMVQEEDLAVMNNDEPRTEEVIRYIDGERYDFISDKYPYKNENGNIVGLMGISRDIRDLKEKEERLQETLKEKNTLLKEVHHRVKNNLQLISSMLDLQRDDVEDPNVVERLDESLNRVQSISLIHETLYESDELAKLDFSHYVDRLINNIFHSYQTGEETINCVKNIEVTDVELDTAIPCGLILTELITNSLEHAFSPEKTGTIEVDFLETEGEYRLSVSDDGPGLPDDFDLTSDGNLGFELIEALVNSNLDGSIQVDGTDGTSVSIVFEP